MTEHGHTTDKTAYRLDAEEPIPKNVTINGYESIGEATSWTTSGGGGQTYKENIIMSDRGVHRQKKDKIVER